MARYFSMQGMGVSLLMVATFLAICEAGYYQQRAMQQHRRWRHYGYYEAAQEAASCELELQAPSKTFTVCVKKGDICTNKAVPACSSGATNCKPIGKDNEALQAFIKQHPEVYAEECVESGAQCLYTDVTYDTCAQAKAMADEVCVKLSDGTSRCSKIVDLVKIAANIEDNQIPPFNPSGGEN